MLQSNAHRAPSYWIQLALATGIATLGLVLGSAAVVIGGMLVSPLMNPIVELGMGFAAGSSLLTIHASLRVLRSVVLVVVSAMVVTYFLPFHEVTPEIASRTAPTALDLGVAICCAFAAVYTTVRNTADTTAAAAGTAIGIALVPPICVVGYGLGTGSRTIATGSALLFTANLSAIVVIAVLAFSLLGFHRVDARRLECEVLARAGSMEDRLANWVYQSLGRVLGARYGLAMRLVVPAIFLALIYIPLAHALSDVAWEVQARTAIRQVLATEAPQAVQTQMSVVRHRVSLSVFMLGSDEQAARLQQRLTTRIATQARVAHPDVTVTAVAGAGALAAAVARAERQQSAIVPVPTAARRPPAADFRTQVGAVLAKRWPTAAAGPLLAWEATVPSVRSDTLALAAVAAASLAGGVSLPTPAVGSTLITVRYLGAPLGSAAEALLTADLADALSGPVRVLPVPLPVEPVAARRGYTMRWLHAVTPVLAAVAATPGAWACVETPPFGRPRSVRQTLQSTDLARTGRLVLTRGHRWALWVAAGSCGG